MYKLFKKILMSALILSKNELDFKDLNIKTKFMKTIKVKV
jgi:hypothetical protein